MRIKQETVKDITVLHLAEDITYSVRGELRAAIERLCSEGCRQLILDLEEVTFLDSAALGLLALLSHQFKMMSGHLSLLNPQAGVREILTLSNMNRIVPIHDSLEEALQANGTRLAGG